ncbi:DUF3592 domain-containing protein [Microbulbifer sp.]|uniref:DUF3592 domain-containing protein n=1 Tax=Microbulbifer sp. TaxID=1908541 RepID=UPI003F3C8FC1
MKKILRIAAAVGLLYFGEHHLGAFSTIHSYYFSDATASTTGKIIQSRKLSGRRSSFHDIKYQYVVDGYTYESGKVSYQAPGSIYSRRMLRKYPEGKDVTVYYDPLNPRYSILEKGGIDLRVFVQAGLISAFAACLALWPSTRPRS